MLRILALLLGLMSAFPAFSLESGAEPPLEARLDGEQASAREIEAYQLFRSDKLIRARELAEDILRQDPNSYVAELVQGLVQHYGESNFPKSAYHAKRALELYEAEHTVSPPDEDVWRWHARMLNELIDIHRDMARYQQQLDYIADYNRSYSPKKIGEQAWPLVKLQRYAEARLMANQALLEDEVHQQATGLVGLCNIEFETGDEEAGYRACHNALNFVREQPDEFEGVYLLNAAEGARAFFRLEESERLDLEATETDVFWYGNPWDSLSRLYLRQGRFAESLNALKRSPGYRAARPVHVQEADSNERRAGLAAFFLVMGRADFSINITQNALQQPGRQAHNSRDPAQDHVVAALLNRRAHRLTAEQLLEQAPTVPILKRPVFWARSAWHRFLGWKSARIARRLQLASADRLVGGLRIGSAYAAAMPPWLAGDLIDILGHGVMRDALRRASAIDTRDMADAYYDAFAAEALWQAGDLQGAIDIGKQALETLPPSEMLLLSRTELVLAEAHEDDGNRQEALRYWGRVLQTDPGLFRRLERVLPVTISVEGGNSAPDIAGTVAGMLQSSPRLDEDTNGLEVRIQADTGQGQACLLDAEGAVLGCGQAERKSDQDDLGFAASIVQAFHETVFAPRLDLSQTEAASLDGSIRVTRDIRQLF